MKAGILMVITLCLLAFFSVRSLAGEAVVLSLDDAISIALRENKDILLNQEKLSQAKLKIGEAKASFFPELNFTGSATITRGLYKKDITNYSTQSGIKQYLYKGGKTMNTLKQSKYEKAVQEAILDKTTNETVLSVKKAFYTLLVAKEFAGLNKEILDNNQAHFEVVKSRYQKGEASDSELLKASSNLSTIEVLYESSLNQLKSANLILKNILYLEETTEIDIKGTLDYEPREIAIDEAILTALSRRPEIRQYEAQTETDKASVEIARSAGAPNIYASWDYYSRSTTSLTFSPGKGWQDYNVIGATLSWPIFDGWLTKYKVEQAISDLRQGKILQSKTKIDIANQVKEAYLDLKTGIAKLTPKKKDIEVYQDNFKVVEDRYKDGILSELDLKDAQLALSVSRFNQVQATYDCLVAKAKLENAMGVR